MQHKLFDLSNQMLDKKENEDLISYIYGNENNVNNFPPSSFVKSRQDIYKEMAEAKSIFNLASSQITNATTCEP